MGRQPLRCDPVFLLGRLGHLATAGPVNCPPMSMRLWPVFHASQVFMKSAGALMAQRSLASGHKAAGAVHHNP